MTVTTRVGPVTFDVPQVRRSGQVRNAAVLLAVGVNTQGKREVLNVSVSLGKHSRKTGSVAGSVA